MLLNLNTDRSPKRCENPQIIFQDIHRKAPVHQTTKHRHPTTIGRCALEYVHWPSISHQGLQLVGAIFTPNPLDPSTTTRQRGETKDEADAVVLPGLPSLEVTGVEQLTGVEEAVEEVMEAEEVAEEAVDAEPD
ncbi:Uu.00g077570.m01.CDS01 [Anthostomella pinea]|uniref:Uu.00g077570.m01.CDS01 n=1 Tax=Anthostomella pinea TaxID=933095 RepID=A0AAI8VW33_9PEZI|nr:Uu.00g077570.m01.CDS01 [Anthostomella pinea]